MPTYLDLRTRIARDLWAEPTATTCAYDADIKDAVREAVRAFQGREFWFAEQDWQTYLGTTVGQQYYPLPDRMAKVGNVKALIGDRWAPVAPRIEEQIDRLTDFGDRGPPEFFCVINKQLRLAPIPDAAYQLSMTGTADLDAPENDGDENVWTNEAFELILYEAEKRLWAAFKKNAAQAQVCDALAREALKTLTAKTSRFKPWPPIVPMEWPC